jgi:predicted phage-related endonuclease
MTTIIPGTYRRGEPGYIEPGTPQWLECITPSKVAAILGESRWESPFGLWQRMKGNVPADPPKDIFAVGHAFELALAELWKYERPGWLLSPGEIQIVLPPEKFGFPALVTLDRRAVRGSLRRVLEIKIARDLADMEKWGAELTDECPDDYWTQVQAQMLFADMTDQDANLMVCGPYWDYRIYDIAFNSFAGAEIIEKCRAFWESLKSDTPPDLDDTVPTYETMRKLHPEIDGSTVQVDPDLGIAVHNANDDAKAADKKLRGLKTRLLDAMGEAQYAEFNGLKVASRSPHGSGSVSLLIARKHPALQAVNRKDDVA